MGRGNLHCQIYFAARVLQQKVTFLSLVILWQRTRTQFERWWVFANKVRTVHGCRTMVNRCLLALTVEVLSADDYLWPNLSAKEHLELFGGLRGLHSSVLEEKVQQWLRSVDLELVQSQYASAYSGGMKRRLSLALATIGDRPLIVLDEPTTGE